MPFTLTPLATYSFTRPDEDPLNPSFWSVWTGQSELQVISNLCSSDGGFQVRGGELYTALTPPNDQYVSVTLGGFDATSTQNQISIRLRVSGDLSTYMNCVLTGHGDGSAQLTIIDEPNENEPISNFIPAPISPGDVLTFGVVGAHFFVLYNGNEILSQVDTQGINSGNVAIFATYNSVFTDCTFSNFEVGHITEDTLVFVPLATDTFHRANENPLNPANWTAITGEPPLAVVSNVAASGGAANQLCGELYTGVVAPADQYAKITINAVGSTETDNFNLELRSTVDGTSGMQFIFANAGDGTGIFVIQDATANEFIQCFINVPNPGDIFTAGVKGSVFFVQLNGVQFLSLNDTLGINSGNTGFSLEFGTTNTDTTVSLFEMGSLVLPPTPSAPSLGNVRMSTGQTSIIGPTHNAHIGSIKFGPRICVQGAGSGISGPSFITQEDGISTILVESGSGSIIPE